MNEPEETTLAVIGAAAPWQDPDPETLDTPEFNAVWSCIKDWDIAVPRAYSGYSPATGNHVRAILDALRTAKCLTTSEG